jgi:hypothetical protein
MDPIQVSGRLILAVEPFGMAFAFMCFGTAWIWNLRVLATTYPINPDHHDQSIPQ